MRNVSRPPNPGSDEALDRGCTCPVLDNNHGRYVGWRGGWIITPGCPLHDVASVVPDQPQAGDRNT